MRLKGIRGIWFMMNGLKWSVNFTMCMWYNDLFSPVLLCKYQPCISGRLLCSTVRALWKCVLMWSFACINMAETSGSCYCPLENHALAIIKNSRSCGIKKLNVTSDKKKNHSPDQTSVIRLTDALDIYLYLWNWPYKNKIIIWTTLSHSHPPSVSSAPPSFLVPAVACCPPGAAVEGG